MINKEDLKKCVYKTYEKSENIKKILQCLEDVTEDLRKLVSKNVRVKLVSGPFFEINQEYMINLVVENFYTTNVFLFTLNFLDETVSIVCYPTDETQNSFIPITEIKDKMELFFSKEKFTAFMGGFSAVADHVKSERYLKDQEEPK